MPALLMNRVKVGQVRSGWVSSNLRLRVWGLARSQLMRVPKLSNDDVILLSETRQNRFVLLERERRCIVGARSRTSRAATGSGRAKIR